MVGIPNKCKADLLRTSVRPCHKRTSVRLNTKQVFALSDAFLARLSVPMSIWHNAPRQRLNPCQRGLGHAYLVIYHGQRQAGPTLTKCEAIPHGLSAWPVPNLSPLHTRNDETLIPYGLAGIPKWRKNCKK